jgi:hypothetical protein
VWSAGLGLTLHPTRAPTLASFAFELAAQCVHLSIDEALDPPREGEPKMGRYESWECIGERPATPLKLTTPAFKKASDSS